jgi:elongation of very long chain fatty acids protein 7
MYYLNDFWNEQGDPRTRDFPLMSNGPWTMFSILLAYLLFVKQIGPHLMKGRQAFNLRHLLLVYNISLVVFNVYFFIEALICIRFGLELFDFKFPDNRDVSPRAVRLINSGYAYFLTKFLDLFDTIFFVLRKKQSQITALHLYHHTVVPLLGWMALRICPTAAPIGLFPIVNSLIHAIMYTYYALSALGPRIKPFLWWKRYITILQLYQFVVYGLYFMLFLCLQKGYPPVFMAIGFVQPFIFFYMFWQFFQYSYCRQRNNINIKIKQK